MENLFRFNSQVGAIACGDRGLKFLLDIPDAPLETFEIPWGRAADFVDWCRGRVPQSPRRYFSRRLDATCRIQQHHKGRTDNAHGLALALSVGDMAVSHWRHGHSLPNNEQAIRIAEHFGWDTRETILDLENERAERAAKTRQKSKKEVIL